MTIPPDTQTTQTTKRTYRTWSEAETRQFINDVREGTSYAAISAKTGRSVRSITVKAAALRAAGHYLPPRCPHTRWSAEEKASLLAMASTSTSYRDMAQKLKRPLSQIGSQLYALRAEGRLKD